MNTIAKLGLSGALMLGAGFGPALMADDHDKKTDVTISEPVEVPGGVVLAPGTYMFRLMEVTGNRHVVRISSEDGKHTFAVAFTAAAHRTTRTSKTILSFYESPAGQARPVRDWFWPGDVDGQQFLYPHQRAGEISKSAHQNVPEAPDDQATLDRVRDENAATK